MPYHPSTKAIMQYFEKLPVSEETKANLDSIRHQCAQLADDMAYLLPGGPELTAGLRKLLEAKDCFVRAAIAKAEQEKPGIKSGEPETNIVVDEPETALD